VRPWSEGGWYAAKSSVATAALQRSLRRGAWRRRRVLTILLATHARRLWRGSGVTGKFVAMRLAAAAAVAGWWAAVRSAFEHLFASSAERRRRQGQEESGEDATVVLSQRMTLTPAR